ncbi:hypothetical protein TWF102_003959 [Orbilia oligospora]|uniref:CBM1 domain-containing protein n=1 Tax=Orbilia oligospora TaxID=2813651 RepID=A0A7C8NT28_ORBOL|nr:hypothetical protein TWF103_009589 [Orbilia oligospora]KAF3103144.1 hypothetical protein TWF102_003959 [Orbilia oligospora]
MVSVETTLAGALMLSLALAQSTTTTNTRPSDVQTLYGLCGGLAAFPTPFTRTLCEDGATCNRPNSFYWQCVPAPRTTPPTTATSEYAPKTTTTPAVTTTTSRLQSRFGQCGGIAWPVRGCILFINELRNKYIHSCN